MSVFDVDEFDDDDAYALALALFGDEDDRVELTPRVKDAIANTHAKIAEALQPSITSMMSTVTDAIQPLVAESMKPIVESFKDMSRQPWMISMRVRVDAYNARRHVLQARTGRNLAELGQTISIDDCERAFDLIDQNDAEGLRQLANLIAKQYDGADLDVALLLAIADEIELSSSTRSLIAAREATSTDRPIPCAHRRAHQRRDIATQPVCAHAPPARSGLTSRPSVDQRSLSKVAQGTTNRVGRSIPEATVT